MAESFFMACLLSRAEPSKGSSMSSSTPCRRTSNLASRAERSSAARLASCRSASAVDLCFSFSSCHSFEQACSWVLSSSRFSCKAAHWSSTSRLWACSRAEASSAWVFSTRTRPSQSSACSEAFCLPCSCKAFSTIPSSAWNAFSCRSSVPSRSCAASRARRRSRSALRTSARPRAAPSAAKGAEAAALMFVSAASSCCRSCFSSSARASSVGRSAATAIASLSSCCRMLNSRPSVWNASWLSRALPSSRRVSSSSAARDVSSPADLVRSSASCESKASRRPRVDSSSLKSKRVDPFLAPSALTAMLPSREMVSPSMVTTLHFRPRSWRTPKTNRRPSSSESAITTSPSRNSKTRLMDPSKERQLRAGRSFACPRSASRSRFSVG
mmetsp:Transcript_25348/g.57244  ORF Transcript_25348/g.57244 Transcript_25348/m.57244 type:complete len:385 (-) Transcript_25348:758-1912(-)